MNTPHGSRRVKFSAAAPGASILMVRGEPAIAPMHAGSVH
jgi:hypothetical protein